MNITLDKQLKKLRKEKDITQEALACHLGITVQAVSKWERAEGLPDISLLPSIASFFNVSVDDLLGVGEIEKEKKIEEYINKNHALFQQGKSKARVELLREAQKEFPNDFRIIYHLMYALQAENRVENAEEIIELGERLLAESSDNDFRDGAIQSLCYTYKAKGDVETAKTYANMAGNYYVTVDQLMPGLLEGDEAVCYCQNNIQHLFDLIEQNTNTLVWKGKYSSEDSIKAYSFVIDCFNLLYPDGDFGFYHCRLRRAYQNIAKEYLAMNDVDQMFINLDKAAYYAINYDTRKDGMYTSFMVNKRKHLVSDAVKDYEYNDSASLLKYLEDEAFVQFQNDERMISVKEKLKQVAAFAE